MQIFKEGDFIKKSFKFKISTYLHICRLEYTIKYVFLTLSIYFTKEVYYSINLIRINDNVFIKYVN